MLCAAGCFCFYQQFHHTNYLTTGSSKLFVAEKLLVVSIGLENPISAGAVAVLETSPFWWNQILPIAHCLFWRTCFWRALSRYVRAGMPCICLKESCTLSTCYCLRRKSISINSWRRSQASSWWLMVIILSMINRCNALMVKQVFFFL